MTERYTNRLNRNSKYFKALNPVWDEYFDDALNVFEMIDELNLWANRYQELLKDYDEQYDTLEAILECFTCADCVYCTAWSDGFAIEYQCRITGDWCIEDNDPCYHFRKCKNE